MSTFLIILNLFLFITLMVTAYIAAFAFSRRDRVLGKYLTLLSLMIMIYAFGYMLELNSTSLSAMVFWNYVQYLGLPFIPPLWFLVIYSFLYHKEIAFKYRLLLFIIPIFVIVTRFTNDWHYLYYTSLTLNESLDIPFMVLGKGPVYYIQLAQLWTGILASLILCLFIHKKENQEIKAISNRLILASLFPWFGGAISVWPFGGWGIDFAAIALPVSIFIFGTIIHKKHFLSFKEMILRRFFDYTEEGFVVFDDYGYLIEMNQYATNRIPELRHFLRKSHEDIIKAFPNFKLILQEKTISQFLFNESYYHINRSPLYDSMDNFIGTVLTFTDVTENVIMIKELQEKQKEISFLSLHDPLTRLHNRAFLENYLKYIQASDYPLGVVFLVLNNLKELNDLEGLSAGDEALRDVAAIINSFKGEYDHGIRLSGDEFLLLIPRCEKEECSKIALKIRNELTKYPKFNVCVGFSTKQNNQTFESVYRVAQRSAE